MRKYFEFYNGAKINCGEEALATIGTELSFFGCEKPLLITSKSETDEKAREKVTNLLKANTEAIVVADNLPATTNEEKIKEIKELYKEQGCDGIVALGSESVMDSAKMARWLLSQECGEILPLLATERVKPKEIPFFAIPTENGSGKEGNGIYEIGETFITSRALIPDVIFIDDEIASMTPMRVTAAGVAYALANAIEAYLGTEEESLTEIYAEKAVRLITKYVEKGSEGYEDDEARRGLTLASTLAGIAYGQVGFGAAHALAEGMSRVTGKPLEEMFSITIIPAMKEAEKKQKKRVKNLLLALVGADNYADTPKEERTQKTIAKTALLLERLRETCGVATKISQTDITRESFGAIAEKASNVRAALTAKGPITKEKFLELLNEGY